MPLCRFARPVPGGDVVFQNGQELADYFISSERHEQPSVDIDWRFRFLGRTRKRDTDVRVLRLSGPIHTQPITATFKCSTPGRSLRHTGIFSCR